MSTHNPLTHMCGRRDGPWQEGRCGNYVRFNYLKGTTGGEKWVSTSTHSHCGGCNNANTSRAVLSVNIIIVFAVPSCRPPAECEFALENRFLTCELCEVLMDW